MVAYKSTLIHMKERIRGYEDAMKTHGLEKTIYNIRYGFLKSDMGKAIQRCSVTATRRLMHYSLPQTPCLLQVYTRFKNLELKVPVDLGLIGFDGNEAFDFFYSPVTYVKQPVDEMGKEAVRILIDQINGSKRYHTLIFFPNWL